MCVYVAPSGADTWVVRDGRDDALGRYRVKRYAVAFASAVAHSRQDELVVHERDGSFVQLPRHTLTYPTTLD